MHCTVPAAQKTRAHASFPSSTGRGPRISCFMLLHPGNQAELPNRHTYLCDFRRMKVLCRKGNNYRLSDIWKATLEMKYKVNQIKSFKRCPSQIWPWGPARPVFAVVLGYQSSCKCFITLRWHWGSGNILLVLSASFRRLLVKVPDYDVCSSLKHTSASVCEPIFVMALFAVAKDGPNSNVHWWVNKMWFIHTMECYPALKRNKILAHATTWMDFKDIMLCKISQT